MPTKIYKVEDTQTGKIHEVEGPEDATPEEVYSFLESALSTQQPSAEPTPQTVPQTPAPTAPPTEQPFVPNAMRDSGVGERTRNSLSLEAVPEARDALRNLLLNEKIDFPTAMKTFNGQFPGVTLPENMANIWAQNRAHLKTPEGRFGLSTGRWDPIAPINRPTGVADPDAPDSALEEFGTSAVRSVYNMANTVRGAAAVGADIVGADETAQKLADSYLEQQAAIGLYYPTSSGQAVDIRSFDDFGRWAASTLGELAPQIGASLGGGAIGGLVGRRIVERKARDFVEQQVANGVAREVAEREVASQVQKAIIRGGAAGAAAVSETQEVGSIYGDTYGATGERKPWTSLLAGTAAASLDTILPARILSKVGGPAAEHELVDSLVKRVGKEAASDFLLEGGTEALQTVIEQLPSGQPIDWSSVVEAGLRGGLGGGAAGTATGAYEAHRQGQATPDTPTAETNTGVPEGASPIAVPTTTNRRTKAYRSQIGETQTQVIDRINTLTNGWTNAPQFEVHESFKDLPNVHKDAIGAVGPDGRVIINTEALVKESKASGRTVDQLVSAVTYHEGLGHHGLALQFGQALDDKLLNILNNSPLYQKRVQDWLEKNPDTYAGDPNSDLRALEEIMAERSESGQLPASFVNVMKNTVKDFGRRMGLDLQYSTREVETILGMSHNAVVNGNGRDVRANGYRYMMTGEKSKTADLESLRVAQNADRVGIDSGPSGSTRTRVNWFKGPDGKWRSELDDSKSNFHRLTFDDLAEEHDDFGETPWHEMSKWQHSTGLDALRSGENQLEQLPLNKVLEHPELFQAYPELADIHVASKAMEEQHPDAVKGSLGFYDPPTKMIYIRSTMSDSQAYSTLLHEVQHAIQDIEGFASGGGHKTALQKMSNELLVKGTKQYLKWLRTEEGRKAVEADARFTGYNVKKVQHVIRDLLENNEFNLLREFFATEKGASSEAYEHLFGEIEARDTEARAHMTRREREKVVPYTSEQNLDPESYIIYHDPHKYMMMSKPEKVKFTPEEIASLSPEELFDSQNAMKILHQMTEGYEPVIMSFDDLENEARLRDLPPSRVIRNRGIGAGELVKRLYMYDIAITKINDRLNTLLEKIQSGNYTLDDKALFLRTTVKQQELAGRIFEDQGEVGRALAAMKNIQYTRRSVTGMQGTLDQFGDGNPFSLLNDPEEFYKFAMNIKDQIDAGKQKMKDHGKTFAANALNLPRALMSTLDLSAPLRQGLFLIHKGAWWRAFFNMFRYWSSEEAFKDLREEIMKRPSYGEMLRAKLALSEIDGKPTTHEESFQTEWAQKIPGLGRLVRMSERAYSGFLNKLRADVFDQLLNKLPEGYTAKDLQDLGRFINAASGRGNLPKGLQSSAPLLNGLLFSPRLIASRVVMTTALVDPRTYTTMNKVARNEYIKSILSVGSLAFLILALAVMGGAEVERDPRSSDFAKIKIGNTRYDILGGEAQYITLASRFYSGAEKTATGEIKPYGTAFGQKTRKDAFYKFGENKAAPIPSFILDYMRGTDAVGQKFEIDRELVQRFVPMVLMDTYQSMQEQGSGKGMAMATPSIFGVGVQTYKSAGDDPTRELEAPVTFNMKDAKDGTYNNATVQDGVVTLDDKAQKEWADRLNYYTREWMKDEVSKPEWKTMTSDERRDVISEVRRDARKEAKADMLEILQIEEDQ